MDCAPRRTASRRRLPPPSPVSTAGVKAGVAGVRVAACVAATAGRVARHVPRTRTSRERRREPIHSSPLALDYSQGSIAKVGVAIVGIAIVGIAMVGVAMVGVVIIL